LPRSKAHPIAKQPLSYYDPRIKEALARDGLHFVRELLARKSRPYNGRPTYCATARRGSDAGLVKARISVPDDLALHPLHPAPELAAASPRGS
jgi:hypothetical protein